MTAPNKNEGLIARLWSLSRRQITGSERQTVEEAIRAIQDLEEEVGRLRSALQQIAHPPYVLGFNRLRGLARKALASTADG